MSVLELQSLLAQVNRVLQQLDDVLVGFEERFGLSSRQLRMLLQNGGDVCGDWLQLEGGGVGGAA